MYIVQLSILFSYVFLLHINFISKMYATLKIRTLISFQVCILNTVKSCNREIPRKYYIYISFVKD